MIKPVSYATILNDPNWPALHAEYDAECSIRELGKSEPQPALYELLEKSGGFQAFGVYCKEKLVGFACVLTYVLPHYGQKVAASESIFISESYRAYYGAVHLMASLQSYAMEAGCTSFLYSAPVGSRFDRVLSGTKRARHTNNVYLVSL